MRRAICAFIAVLGLAVMHCAAARAAATSEIQEALAPKGQLRVALLNGDATQALKDTASGDLKGVGVDLGRDLAQRTGLPFQPVLDQSIGALLDGGKSGDWDIAFIGVTPARAKEWDFAPPHLEVEFGYLVSAGSSIATLADVDRPGIQVGVQERSGPDAFLSRTLKNGTIVQAPDYASTVEMLKSGKIDVIFSIKPILYELSEQMAGSHVLDGTPGTVPQAMAIPKGRDVGMRYVRNFVEAAKSEGLIKDAIDRAGLRGVIVPGDQIPTR